MPCDGCHLKGRRKGRKHSTARCVGGGGGGGGRGGEGQPPLSSAPGPPGLSRVTLVTVI